MIAGSPLSDVNNPLSPANAGDRHFRTRRRGVAQHDIGKLDAVIDVYADRLEAALQRRNRRDRPGAARQVSSALRAANYWAPNLNPGRKR